MNHQNSSTEDVTKICHHCEEILSEDYKFCPNCGHRFRAGIITLGSLIREFRDYRFTDIKIFIKTLKDLVLTPSTVINAYLNGKRDFYYNPFNFFLLIASTITFMTLTFQGGDPTDQMQEYNKMFGNDELVAATEAAKAGNNGMLVDSLGNASDSTAQIQIPEGMTEEDFKRAQKVSQWQLEWMKGIQKYFNLLMLFTVPFYAVGIWLVSRKSGYNIGQTLILTLYTYGFTSFTSIFLIPFVNPFDFSTWAKYVTLPIFFVFMAWAFRDFYQISWLRGFWRIIISYILYFVFFMIFVVIIAIISVIVILVMQKALGMEIL